MVGDECTCGHIEYISVMDELNSNSTINQLHLVKILREDDIFCSKAILFYIKIAIGNLLIFQKFKHFYYLTQKVMTQN